MSSPITQMWSTLDALNPMPISRSRDRICTWLYECKCLGLITPEEYKKLLDSDAADRRNSHA